jgi:hypothetical protein
MGLCGRSLSEFIDWRYSQSCWYFRPSFLTCCLWFNYTPPSPLPCVKVQYIQTVCGLEGGGVGGVGDYILQELNTLYLIRFRTYKIARPPQTKT